MGWCRGVCVIITKTVYSDPFGGWLASCHEVISVYHSVPISTNFKFRSNRSKKYQCNMLKSHFVLSRYSSESTGLQESQLYVCGLDIELDSLLDRALLDAMDSFESIFLIPLLSSLFPGFSRFATPPLSNLFLSLL